MNQLISVIIPVYNRAHTLADCLDSVKKQSYENWEVILTDDGSTDGTQALCAQYAAQDPRFRLFPGSHAGVSAARNRALEEAQGEYVFFLDSDDAIHPLLLESLLKGLVSTGASMAGTPLQLVSERTWAASLQKLTAEPYVHPAIACQSAENALHTFFHTENPLTTIGGVMMHRDLIGQTRFRTDLTISEDFLFIYENLIKGTATVHLQQAWYFCRMHTQNTSLDHSFDGFLSRFRRRQLVWENEARMGRHDNARVQRGSAFFIYLRCLNACPDAAQRAKMAQHMKQNKKGLLEGMSLKEKLRFHLFVYAPFTFRWYVRLKKLIKGK